MEANSRTNRMSFNKSMQAIRRLGSRKLNALESATNDSSDATSKTSASSLQVQKSSGSCRSNTVKRSVSPYDIQRRLRSRIQDFKVSLTFNNVGPTWYPTETAGKNHTTRLRDSPMDDLLMGKDTTICQSDIPKLFLDQGESRNTLLGMLVLSAEDGVVEAGSCEFIMRKKFGETGLRLLRHIACALQSPDRVSSCSSMTIRLNQEHIAVVPRGHGEDPSLALLWLCLAVRIPEFGWVSTSERTREGPYGCHRFGLNDLKGLASSAGGASCWHPLFHSAVVAVEPSVKFAPESLLQVDFDTLVQLAAVEYAVRVDSGIVLLGYSTALIPVKALDNDVLLWHFEVCPHESQFKVTELQATKTEWLESEDIGLIRSKTARVGWCSESKVLLGTSSLLQSPVGWSSGTTQRKSWRWKDVSLQAVAASTTPLQIGLQGGATFERVINTLRFDVGQNYLQLLRSSSRESIVLYDVDTKRGWLVPLLSVLHHMALAYCQNGIAEEGNRVSIPFAKPDANGGMASQRALWHSGSLEIETGGDDSLTLRSLLMGISVNLAKISPQKPRHGKIFGYEFMDVVQEVPTANLKRVQIKNEGQCWISLLESLPCLFCSNLGDAIVTAIATTTNPDCCRLITGRDYMAASIHCLDSISKRQGQSRMDGDLCFPGGYSWRPTRRVFWGCGHTDGVDNCWKDPTFMQQIRDKQPASSTNTSLQTAHKNGVVVFGETRPSRLRGLITRGTATPTITEGPDILPLPVKETNVNSPDQGPWHFVVSFFR